MAIRDYRKVQRPPAAGTLVGVRLQPEALAALDAWISVQPDAPSRPEAVRRLLARALATEGAIQATDDRITARAQAEPNPRRKPRA